MVNKKNIRIGILCSLLLAMQHILLAQVSISQNVLGTSSGGGTIPASGNNVDYTVGETVVFTGVAASGPPFSVAAVTQGFQQPNSANSTLNETVLIVNSTCIGANNGSVMFSPVTSTGTVTVNWDSTGAGTTFLFEHLAPGSYPYTISDGSFTINGVAVITEDQVDCGSQLSFYHGITPNGDSHNDDWQIDGITNFADRNVLIYNRWGDLVWRGANYDNVNIVWKGLNLKGQPLPDATYFYLVEAGGHTYKGWVELTH